MSGVSPDALKILVVDDEPAMVGALGALLGRAGHRIVAAYDGDEALRRFRDESPDLVLLDLAMPGTDGAEVCRTIRAESITPIIVVTGERERGVLVELLDMGADDYIRKPFRSDELLARVRAVMRRAGERAEDEQHNAHGWELDLPRHEIRWRGAEVPATAIEFRILALLVERMGDLVPHGDLLEAGWPGVPFPDPLWLKSHLARLRQKLAALGAPSPAAIRAVGYRLEGEALGAAVQQGPRRDRTVTEGPPGRD